VTARRIVALLRASALAVLLAGPLAGCVAWAPEPPAAVAPVRADPTETFVPELRLVEAVERAERALASLARAVPAPEPASHWPGSPPSPVPGT
jgi:hypothetical protein